MLMQINSPSVLRLPSQDKPADRRTSRRSVLHVRVQGARLDNTLEARTQPCVSLAVQDFSPGGIRAIADRPLQEGEQVAIYFQPVGYLRGCDRYASVIRCERRSPGYQVALRFESRKAA